MKRKLETTRQEKQKKLFEEEQQLKKIKEREERLEQDATISRKASLTKIS
jgi:hypothetical protein